MKPMYKEPHLQRKSDQCALIWKNWYNYKYGLKNEKAAARYRKLWCKCVDEHSEMCKREVESNPVYSKLKQEKHEPN